MHKYITWTVYTTPRLFNDCEKLGLIPKASCITREKKSFDKKIYANTPTRMKQLA